jgi:small-conductance mechanosensitive channel
MTLRLLAALILALGLALPAAAQPAPGASPDTEVSAGERVLRSLSPVAPGAAAEPAPAAPLPQGAVLGPAPERGAGQSVPLPPALQPGAAPPGPAPAAAPAPAPPPVASPAPAAPAPASPAPTAPPPPAGAPAPPAPAARPAPAAGPAAASRPESGASQPRAAAPAAPTPAAPPPPAAAPAPAQAPAAPALSPELAALLEILRDEARRAALIRALEAGRPAEAEAAAPAPTPAEARPEELPVPAEIVQGLADRLSAAALQLLAAISSATELQGVRVWFGRITTDERLQQQVLALSWKLGLVMLAGLLAERLLRFLLRRPYRWLEERSAAVQGPLQGLRRLPYILGHLLLDLVPVAGFGLAGLAVIGLYAIWPSNRLIMEAVVVSYMVARLVMAAARLVFAPDLARLRLIRCTDETAAYAMVWTRRLALTAAGFYVASATAGLLGLPLGAQDGIWRAGLLVISAMIAVIVLQNRAAVAGLLDAPELREGDAPDATRRFLRAARTQLAQVWHIAVILWLLAAWTVWALDVERGFERLAASTLASVVVVGVGKLADELMRRWLIRAFTISEDLAKRNPGLEARANRYLPVLKGAVSGLILAATLVALLEVWGLNSLAWFQPGRWGGRVVSALLTIASTMGVALLIWELANAGIQRHLNALPKDGSAARSARVRTLLPMLRTALAALLLVVVGLTTLSEIGINVAPLLAGAGVVGLAIGFGSQTLVRDVITGIFLLLEDAVAVGDTVTVGGLSGTVEQLSIRSIKLRALDGSVHIIPFSAVTTVTNQTRDFGYAVVDLALDHRADTDEAVMLLRRVGEEMREDEAWAPQLLAPLEVLGVDRLTETGVVVRARIMTPPARRWAVGRELNRRIKQRADAEGLPLCNTNRPTTVVVGAPAATAAPA